MSARCVHVLSEHKPIIEQIAEALGEEFQCYSIEVGSSVEDALKKDPTELLIIDVESEKFDGYSVCSELKSGFDFDDIPVVLLSSASNFEERIKGYEAGAEDFIQKPFHPEECKARIQAVIRYKKTVDELKERADSAMQTVLSMITSSGEMGYVIDFLRASYRCESVESLAEALLQTCDDYGLNILLRFQVEGKSLFRGNVNGGTPLEQSLFDHVPENVRIHSFNHRCVFHYGSASILVKNMPIEDEDKCGRIRDNLAIIAEGAKASLKTIQSMNDIKRRTLELQELMEQSCKILELFKSKSAEQRVASAEIMSDLIEKFELKFMHLGLTEDQEVELIDIAKGSDQKQNRLYEVGDALEAHLTSLIFGFEKALRNSR